MAQDENVSKVFENLVRKGALKQQVYNNTLEAFRLVKREASRLVVEYQETMGGRGSRIPV
ncbi:MAG: hypothetical protein IH599_09045, partial [Bacteroidales bacterium]|nr:hypothetical protein [Bacteroidales bacterium]